MDRHPVLVDFLAVIALAGVTVGPESKWHAEGLNTPRWWLATAVCFVPPGWRGRRRLPAALLARHQPVLTDTVGTGNGRSFTPLIQATGRIVVR